MILLIVSLFLLLHPSWYCMRAWIYLRVPALIASTVTKKKNVNKKSVLTSIFSRQQTTKVIFICLLLLILHIPMILHLWILLHLWLIFSVTTKVVLGNLTRIILFDLLVLILLDHPPFLPYHHLFIRLVPLVLRESASFMFSLS